MARVAIAVNEIDASEGIEATQTTLDATNDHSLTADNVDKLIVAISSTTGSSKTVTFKAGDSSAALRSGIGDLVVTVQANEWRFVRIETARFANSDGTIHVDIEAAMTGAIFALSPA